VTPSSCVKWRDVTPSSQLTGQAVNDRCIPSRSKLFSQTMLLDKLMQNNENINKIDTYGFLKEQMVNLHN
jgi:hypothetical protein